MGTFVNLYHTTNETVARNTNLCIYTLLMNSGLEHLLGHIIVKFIKQLFYLVQTAHWVLLSTQKK